MRKDRRRQMDIGNAVRHHDFGLAKLCAHTPTATAGHLTMCDRGSTTKLPEMQSGLIPRFVYGAGRQACQFESIDTKRD